MGSASSRLATRWWEAEAQRKLVTTKNTAMVGFLKKRSDLDTLFQNLSRDQHADPSNLPVDFKANELWRALQMPLEYNGSPWDWNWQPPLEGTPSQIAAEYHAAVCQAIFRIPFSDFVKYALGYTPKARFLNDLLHGVCDTRDKLRTEFLDRPQIKEIYIGIEKVLKQRHHPLAHWIVASSLHHSGVAAPYDNLAPNLEPIRAIFAARDFDLVLTNLAALDRRFAHGSQMYNWQKWSTDVDFWHCIDGVIWSGKVTAQPVRPHMSSEDRDERLRFLQGFQTDTQDRAYGRWSKVVFSVKRLIGRDSQYNVKKGLLMSMGPMKDSPKSS